MKITVLKELWLQAILNSPSHNPEKLILKLGKVWGIPTINKKLVVEVGYQLTKSLGRCIPQKGLIQLNPIL